MALAPPLTHSARALVRSGINGPALARFRASPILMEEQQ
jgi:hypothetical protein